MKFARFFLVLSLVCWGLQAASCEPDELSDGEDPREQPLAGGDTTVFDRTSNAYLKPAPNLTDANFEFHLEGDLAFDAVFVTSPAIVNPGLGPVFNNTACVNCHVRNGRGLPVMGTGGVGSPALVRVSLPPGSGSPEVPGGAVPVPGMGTQIQDHAIYGYDPEATVAIAWTHYDASYPDGTAYTLRAPVLTIETPDGAGLAPGTQTSLRIPPPVFGLGLLEAIAEETLESLTDEDDSNGDGISGRINYVWDAALAEHVVGRFGQKANQPHLLQQAAAAYVNDIGVTNALFPESDGSTDIEEIVLEAAAFYTQTLGVPARADWDNPTVIHGERLFESIGCMSCHVGTVKTGEHAMAELSNQTIHPYTDLLIHDMGPGLADNREDFAATGNEWRTAPLWGLGLVQTVLPEAGFLHDGRARTVEEAILWHGGEAENAKSRFRNLDADERAAVLLFLGSL